MTDHPQSPEIAPVHSLTARRAESQADDLHPSAVAAAQLRGALEASGAYNEEDWARLAEESEHLETFAAKVGNESYSATLAIVTLRGLAATFTSSTEKRLVIRILRNISKFAAEEADRQEAKNAQFEQE